MGSTVKVFCARRVLGHQLLIPAEGEELSFGEIRDGRRSIEPAVRVHLVTHDGDQRLAETDVLHVEPVMAFTRSAWTRCRPLLKPHGRAVPLTCDDADVVGFDVVTELDALDFEAAEVTRFGVDLDIVGVDRWAFDVNRLTDLALFHIPVRGAGDAVLATGDFVEHWESLRLAGMTWNLA